MAKKKAAPPKGVTGPKANGLVIRCSDEWRAWLSRLADHDQSSMAEVLTRGAQAYARKVGFTEVAPRR
jgi:hypothetical protein